VLPYVSTSPDFLGADISSEAIDDKDVDEGLARGVSDGEMFVEGADEAGADSVVSKRRRGAVSDGSAVVVAMTMCWKGPGRKEEAERGLQPLSASRTFCVLEEGLFERGAGSEDWRSSSPGLYEGGGAR
jgi:hypothetical protein